MVKSKLKRIVMMSLGMSMLFSDIVFSSGEIDSLKEQRDELNNQIEAQQNEIHGINMELNQVVNEIRTLDYQISKSQQELDFINNQLHELELEIQKNVENLQKAKDNLSEKQEELGTRLREQYKSGDVIFLEVLMGSSNVVDMLTKFDIVENVINQDKELLEFTNKQITYIEEIEAKLQEQKDEYQLKLEAERSKKIELEAANRKKIEYMSVLEDNKVMAENQYDNFVDLTTSLDERIVILEKELEEKRKAEEEARRRAAEAKRAADEQAARAAGLNSYSGEEVSLGSGELVWPVSGYYNISSYYGYRIHPIFNTQKFHSGIDIPAPSGTLVRASDSGIVIFSGWQGGYGNCVMISHGDNIVTVYAHNSALSVSVGEYVDAGQTVALIGSTGYSTGPHLHFEVRKNGSPTNPLNWL